MIVRMRTRVVAAVAVGLTLGVLSAGTGLADTPATVTPTQITLAVNPSTVAYPGPQTLIVSGVLETMVGTPQALPGQTIQLAYFYGPWHESLGSVTTSAGGAFSWTGTLPDQPGAQFVPGAFGANFDGNAQYGRTGKEVWPQPTQQFPARIVLNPIQPANYTSTVDVTGQVQMHVGSHWVPSPYAEIGLAAAKSPYACRPAIPYALYGDASGDFSVPIEADPGLDQCAIVTRPTGNRYQWSLPDATPAAFTVPLIADPTYPVNISFSSPQTAPSLQIMTRIVYLAANDTTHVYTGPVQLQFQAPGTTTWVPIATRTPVRDWTTFTVSAFGPHGSIRAGNWRLHMQPESAKYLGFTSAPLLLAVTVPTQLSARLTGRTLTGHLAYLTRGGEITQAKVEVQKLIRGRWRDVASAVTNESGGYSARLSGTGTCRVLYSGGKLPGAQSSYGSFTRALSKTVRLQ